MDYKELITEKLREVERDGIDELIAFLDNSGFYTSPCSGGNHLAVEGGLAEHSWNVYEIAMKIWGMIDDANNLHTTYESIVVSCILHDVGKIGDHGKDGYIPNMLKTGISKSKPYKTNGELLYIPHEVRSVAIIERYLELTEEEEHAIYYHNGKYTHTGYDLKETPLQMILHFADLWCSRVVEVGGEKDA